MALAPYFPDQLKVIREFPCRLLRIDQFISHDHFENTTTRFYQVNLGIEMFLQDRRQTDGASFVASHSTEFDRDFHIKLPA
jgi:hypothetical protein